MTAADRQLLEQLPPELTAAALLRQALNQFRAEAPACDHRHVRCADCGAHLQELVATE
ncbi:MAG TPA: hypothetical protein VFN61_04465 [Acidimicrobiales bacterium]|nr:hypothetical protein [Acidimicrobiales bacterium]